MQSESRLHYVLYSSVYSLRPNVPPEKCKCTTGGTCTPGWEPLAWHLHCKFIYNLEDKGRKTYFR